MLWNSGRVCLNLLRSLEAEFAAGLGMIIVDNASADDSVAVVERFLAGWQYAQRVEIVRSSENLGFCGGVNLGTEYALAADPEPSFLWLLNPDAIVPAGTLRELLEVAEESRAGVVCVHTNTWFPVPESWPAIFWLPPRLWSRPFPDERRWAETGCYVGSCAVFDAPLIRRLIARDGHFQDPALFMDWDEWETSLRIRRLGGHVVRARDARQVHDLSSRTFGGTRIASARQYYKSRNTVVVARRHMSARAFWPLLLLHVARDVSWLVRRRLRGEQSNVRDYLEGTFHAVRGRTGRWSKHPPG